MKVIKTNYEALRKKKSTRIKRLDSIKKNMNKYFSKLHKLWK